MGKAVLDEGLVKKVNAVYAFKIEGSQAGTYHIDLKNGSGSVGAGEPSGQAADVTFTLKDADFVSMFEGKLKPTNAFMTGKLKLAGDMGKAMALEKMMKKMNKRGFHTSAYRDGDVSKVFDDVKGVLDEGLVKKVNAVYAFKVEGHFHSNAVKGVRDFSTVPPLVYENVPQVFERIETI